MNWLDRTIGVISPQWAYKRVAWRNALRGYDAGSTDRLNSGWTAVNATAEQTDRVQRDMIRARARDLERNADIAEGIIGPFERNVVGTGIRLQAKVLKDTNEEDDNLNRQIEELWKEWSRARNCDITGQQSFQELQQMAIRRLKVDGGLMFIKAYTADGTVPFCLQAREVDDLDISLSSITVDRNQNRIVSGIELDKYNKPVAYWLKKYSVDGFYTGESERIPAQQVIFLWKKTRPTQVREVSPMAKTLPRVRDVNEFMEAVSVKERILACLSVFITKVVPTGVGRGTTHTVDAKTGYKQKTISPGMVQELQPGESVSTVNPSGQSSNAREFIQIQQRLAGSGQGLSYEAVSRDMSQVNYSSARQGLLEDQRTYAMEQQFLIEHFCYEVYSEFIISAVLSGKLKIPDFWQNKLKYLRHEWIASGWSWIDPVKEVTANKIALSTGQDTLARICAERGMDWRDVLKQKAKEIELAKALGVDISGGVNNNAQNTETTNRKSRV